MKCEDFIDILSLMLERYKYLVEKLGLEKGSVYEAKGNIRRTKAYGLLPDRLLPNRLTWYHIAAHDLHPGEQVAFLGGGLDVEGVGIDFDCLVFRDDLEDDKSCLVLTENQASELVIVEEE